MNKSIHLQVGVKIFLKNDEGRYLLLKRSKEIYPNLKNLWDIPGGRIIPGTPLLENLRREIREETGYFLDDSPILIAAQDIIRGREKHIVRLTFLGNVSCEPKKSPVLNIEHTEYCWSSFGEMLENDGLDEFTRETIKSGCVTEKGFI